jgi:hypothetical protein
MITFPLIAVFATALFFAAVPVVLFALMLETVSQRSRVIGPKPAHEASAPATAEFTMQAAA